VPVNVEVGAEGEQQRDCTHGGAEERNPLAAQHNAAENQGDQQRHPDVGAVLDG
jgi:hypothetical protein